MSSIIVISSFRTVYLIIHICVNQAAIFLFMLKIYAWTFLAQLYCQPHLKHEDILRTVWCFRVNVLKLTAVTRDASIQYITACSFTCTHKIWANTHNDTMWHDMTYQWSTSNDTDSTLCSVKIIKGISFFNKNNLINHCKYKTQTNADRIHLIRKKCQQA